MRTWTSPLLALLLLSVLALPTLATEPTSNPTATATEQVTATPSDTPTDTPTESVPSEEPTPTDTYTASPSDVPSDTPTTTPTATQPPSTPPSTCTDCVTAPPHHTLPPTDTLGASGPSGPASNSYLELLTVISTLALTTIFLTHSKKGNTH